MDVDIDENIPVNADNNNCSEPSGREQELNGAALSTSNSSFSDSTMERSSGSNSSIKIKASFDAGWQKRGTGRTYDSLTGHATLIGTESQKILAYTTRVKRCARCEAGWSKDSHDCRLNFTGSAKAMEPDMAVQLITQNADLKKHNVIVNTLIGDDDSATIASVRRQASHNIAKWSDLNHASKSFNNDLYKVKPKLTTAVIDYLHYNFGCAIKKNRGNAEAVKAALSAIVPHAFDDHSLCGEWCGYLKDPLGYTHKYLPNGECLKGETLFNELNKVIEKFIKNADKLAPCGSSQGNESFNRIVLSKHPKSVHYGRSESLDYRVALSVCQKNIGTSFVVKANEKISLSPGDNTKKFREKQDIKRLAQKLRSRSIAFKRKRLTGKKIRAIRRTILEGREGTTYKSGCGLEENFDDPVVQMPSTFLNKKLVIFDVETTGLSKTAEVIQIGAKFKQAEFSQYIIPSRGITREASEVTGLSMQDGQLCLNGIVVPTVSQQQAYDDFLQFLGSISSPVVLAAHNGYRFDFPLLMKEIQQLHLWGDFKSLVCGFVDTLPFLKLKLPERVKEKKSFKQECLAQELLPSNNANDAHNALGDVRVLSILLEKLGVGDEELVTCAKPINYVAVERDLKQKQNEERERNKLKKQLIKENIQSLLCLQAKGVSLSMINKIGKAEITPTALKTVCSSGKDSLTLLLQNITRVPKCINTIYSAVNSLPEDSIFHVQLPHP